MMEMNYKVYKVSPKLYRELQEMAELMGAKVRKPNRTQGTRWLAHLGNALDAILKNYAPLISHLEDLVADRRSSADLQGKARRILKIITDFPTLKFMFFLQDILDSMSKLSKNLQKDSSSLAEASRAVDATSFQLGNLGREAGKHLQSFLEEMRGSDDQTSFRGHELKRVEMEDKFDRNRSDVVNKLQRHLTKRFESLRQDEVSAATTILNTIQWPQTSDELESYGNTSVDFVCRHFKAILEHHKCELESIMYEWQEAKLYISGLPRARQQSAWKDIIMDEELRAKIPNLLHIVEILLVLPISTAACERGFSCMKRVKSDWRSSLTVDMLSKLMFVVLNGPEVKDFNAAGALKVWWKSERTRRTDYMD
ncbi:zinc finger protein 862-like [Lytechinus variegatus]|uniref:zinc finger protein 862-like n=1 Tax=Lytechinus variegatus TaxID=7654 RepID=UPI001BB237E7|nr:zinc finger protein 862-like [Lytechinus variegatus]